MPDEQNRFIPPTSGANQLTTTLPNCCCLLFLLSLSLLFIELLKQFEGARQYNEKNKQTATYLVNLLSSAWFRFVSHF